MKDVEYTPGTFHVSNYTDCITCVQDSLGEYADEFDIDAIVDEYFDFVPSELCWQCDKDEDAFWEIAQKYDMGE